ncbi:hypothetical protein [Dyadobacter diqingensis]|uniref:hypothetical protein n=1 Tax=Dyadobacter diqingensis TaxID=2938121 RepID=UPI0020C498E6|nr:hypothetical protein [Dyadobacter diqingensis]
MPLITPAIKDTLLNHFVENYSLGQLIDLPRDQNLLGLSGGELASLTNQFVKMDLVKEWGSTRDSITISLNVESHDFIGRGGFYGQEILFQKNVEKIIWEIDRFEVSDVIKKPEIQSIKENIIQYMGLLANLGTAGDLISKIS